MFWYGLLNMLYAREIHYYLLVCVFWEFCPMQQKTISVEEYQYVELSPSTWYLVEHMYLNQYMIKRQGYKRKENAYKIKGPYHRLT